MSNNAEINSKPKIGTLGRNWDCNAEIKITQVARLSDYRNYWNAGYSAAMITDTSFYRNQNYHTAGDTPDTLDYARMAKVVQGVFAVVQLEAN